VIGITSTTIAVYIKKLNNEDTKFEIFQESFTPIFNDKIKEFYDGYIKYYKFSEYFIENDHYYTVYNK